MALRWLIFFLLGAVSLAHAKDLPLEQECQLVYQSSGHCPNEICNLGCADPHNLKECVFVCTPKPCEQLPADHCPPDRCAVMKGCSGGPVCFSKPPASAQQCGSLAYYGDDVPCCKGLVKRCGLEFLDGTCDMEGKNSIYSVPICIPCGNGICNQFENACNCPEDCAQEKKPLPISVK